MSVSIPALKSKTPIHGIRLPVLDTVCTVAILLAIAFSTLLIAREVSNTAEEWSKLDQGISATIIGETKETREYGDIALVEYRYGETMHRGMAMIPVDAFVGGPVKIVVEKASGEVENDRPSSGRNIGSIVVLGLAIILIASLPFWAKLDAWLDNA